jgi:hypothetical protein
MTWESLIFRPLRTKFLLNHRDAFFEKNIGTGRSASHDDLYGIWRSTVFEHQYKTIRNGTGTYVPVTLT